MPTFHTLPVTYTLQLAFLVRGCFGQKWSWGRFSPRTSVSPANLHSICYSTIIFTISRGCHIWPGGAAVPIASKTRIKKKKKQRCLQLVSVAFTVLMFVAGPYPWTFPFSSRSGGRLGVQKELVVDASILLWKVATNL
jgi:hypothetical protein